MSAKKLENIFAICIMQSIKVVFVASVGNIEHRQVRIQ